jgi:hypothetical protein
VIPRTRRPQAYLDADGSTGQLYDSFGLPKPVGTRATPIAPSMTMRTSFAASNATDGLLSSRCVRVRAPKTSRPGVSA